MQYKVDVREPVRWNRTQLDDYEHLVDGTNCIIGFRKKKNVSIGKLATWERCIWHRGNDARLTHATGSTSTATFLLGSEDSTSVAWFGYRRGAINGTTAYPFVLPGF